MHILNYSICEIFNCLPKVLKELRWQNKDVERVSVGLASVDDENITFEMRVDFKSDRLCLSQTFIMSNSMFSEQAYGEVANHMLLTFIERIKKV